MAEREHIGQNLFGPVDLDAGDLHALAMEQHAEVTPQIFSFVEGQRFALFEAGKNDLETLLDASGEQLRGAQRLARK